MKFDEIKEKGIEKGELNIFVKDFDIKIPIAKQLECFKKVSRTQNFVTLDQFEELMPLLAQAHIECKIKELKNKLNEIKRVMEYPAGKVDYHIEAIINNQESDIENKNNNMSQRKVITDNKQKMPMMIEKEDHEEAQRMV